MNKIDNKLLLSRGQFMSELQLRQSGSAYSACGPFYKNRERIQKLREIGNLKHIYKNKL